jgi:hypothetical protein
MKYEIIHIDSCTSDYWSGHHLPHICIPLYRMLKTDLISALKSEVNQGAIAGSDFDYTNIPYDDFNQAIDNIEFVTSTRKKYIFDDFKWPVYSEPCYGYFIFQPTED